MATPQPAKALTGDEARGMKQLTNELEQVLHKIANIIRSQTGTKTEYNVCAIIQKSGNNPLQIGFNNAKIKEVKPGTVNADEADEIGYYIDPPGVCTTVPACIPEE